MNPQVTQWAKQMVEVALIADTETTGLSDGHEAVELSIVRAKDRAVLFDSLLRASQPCEQGAADVHGITPDQIALAPRPADVWPQIEAAVNGKIVIAYNSVFDERILKTTAKLHGLPFLSCEWQCLMQKTMLGLGIKARGYSLLKACNYFNIEPGGHRALSDCLAALGVLNGLAGNKPPPPEDYLPMMTVSNYLREKGWINLGDKTWHHPQMNLTKTMNEALDIQRAVELKSPALIGSPNASALDPKSPTMF